MWSEADATGRKTGFSAAVTTPLDVVKTRLMLGKDAQGVAYNGAADAVKRIYAEGGAARFFSGLCLSLPVAAAAPPHTPLMR